MGDFDLLEKFKEGGPPPQFLVVECRVPIGAGEEVHPCGRRVRYRMKFKEKMSKVDAEKAFLAHFQADVKGFVEAHVAQAHPYEWEASQQSIKRMIDYIVLKKLGELIVTSAE